MKPRFTALVGIALGFCLVVGVSGASADQEEDQAQTGQAAQAVLGASCSGPLAMPVPQPKLAVGSDDRRDRSQVWVLPTALVAGSYAVSAGSEDPAHPSKQDQLYESWYAVFTNDARQEVGRTAVTPDLAQNKRSDAWNLPNLVLSGPATRVQYFHAPVPPNATDESIRVSCLNLTLIPFTGSCTGQVNIPGPGVTLFRTGKGSPNATAKIPLAKPLKKGTYGVVAGSRDTTHPGGNEQGEQWVAKFFAANGNLVGQTAATPDLSESQVTQIFTVGTVTITKSAKTVQFVHANLNVPPNRADSVEPLCLSLSANQYPPRPNDDDEDDDEDDDDGPRNTTSTSTTSTSTTSTSTTSTSTTSTSTTSTSTTSTTVPKSTTSTTVAKSTTTTKPKKDDDDDNEGGKGNGGGNGNGNGNVNTQIFIASTPFPDPTTTVATTTTLPPTTVPTATTSAVTTVVAPAAVEVAGVSVARPATEVLGTSVSRPVAFTGANSKPMLMVGLGFTGLGSLLLMASRRRRRAVHRR